MRLKISDPVVVAAGPESAVTGWGVYQFPDIERLSDGRLMIAFADSSDTIDAYGAERGCYVSCDEGKTWTKANERALDPLRGLLLDNGDRVQFVEQDSVKLTDEMQLPPVAGIGGGYAYHRADQMPENICKRTWIIRRVNAEYPDGIDELVTLNWPDMLIRSGKGIVVPPQPWGRLRKDADGVLWMPTYSAGIDPDTGEFSPYLNTYLLRSADHGHTWDLVNILMYKPEDHLDDFLAYDREGYNENNITFAPDGSYIRLIRSDGSFGRVKSTMYLVRSTDKGMTWCDPIPFDDRGVWPQLLTLDCGVTLASYGRPGFFVRATSDPACLNWEERIQLVENGTKKNKSTCSYSDLIALDDHTAGLVYTDFTVKDENGIARKTVLFRTITVEN